MTNEIIFLLHTLCISFFTIFGALLGAETLMVITVVHCILANLFVTKQVNLFFFSATGTDAFILGAVLGLNLLQEYEGKEAAIKTILINFFILCYFICMSVIQLRYIPNNFDTAHNAFNEILSPLPRIGLVSVIVFFIVQFCDYFSYQFLKNLFKGNYFVFRNFIATAASQFLDTALFTYFALSGIVEKPLQVFLMSYSIKLLAMFIISPVLFLFVDSMQDSIHKKTEEYLKKIKSNKKN